MIESFLSGIEFKMTEAADLKEQKPKLVLDGVVMRYCGSEEQNKQTDRLMIMDV